MITFKQYYIDLTGHVPFQWQEQLAEMWTRPMPEWHNVLGLPVCSGKSDVALIWLYAKCISISHNDNTIPTRLFYVVNRRVLIDERFEITKQYIQKLKTEKSLKWIYNTLCSFSNSKEPLAVHRLRGGLEKNKPDWINSPLQPTIVYGTVDQIGSRLLMRGYGTPTTQRLMNASLIAKDSLIVVDENQTVQPFCHLIKSISNIDQTSVGKAKSSRILHMSATTVGEDQYKLSINDEILKKRHNAPRPVHLIAGKGTIAKIMAEQTLKIFKDPIKVLAVVCNTVPAARATFDLLKKEKIVDDNSLKLLIGPVRYWERDILVEELFRRLGKRDRANDTPLIVVTTQTIELGVNFDFDAIISQSAPQDCLIQRFGRMNRFGEFPNAVGFIVHRKDNEEEDIVYKEKTQQTFDYLTKTYDKKIENITAIKQDESLFAKAAQIVDLEKETVMQLAHANGHNVYLGCYLHGLQEADTDVSIVYRLELDRLSNRSSGILRKNEKDAKRWLKLARPQPHEILNVSLRTLLANSEKNYRCIIYDNENEPKVTTLKNARPGCLIVVPTTFGKHDNFGWSPASSKDVEDVFDRANKKKILRLHPTMLPGFNLSNYIEAEEGLPDTETVKNMISQIEELGLTWKKSKVGPAQAFAALESNFELEFTPDHKGLYIYRSREKFKNEKEGLESHSSKVMEKVKNFCKALGFNSVITKTFSKAALFHDIGKCYPPYQYMLGGTPDNPLAKSGNNNNLKSWRHEYQSGQLAAENGALDDVNKELAYYLIISHHGYAPLPPPTSHKIEEFPPFLFGKTTFQKTTPYTEYALSHGTDYFHNLCKNCGPWTVAYFEAVFRLADWAASKQTNKEDKK